MCPTQSLVVKAEKESQFFCLLTYLRPAETSMLQLSIFQSQVPCLTTDDGLNREFSVQGDVGRKNVKWFGDHFNFIMFMGISKFPQASVSKRG